MRVNSFKPFAWDSTPSIADVRGIINVVLQGDGDFRLVSLDYKIGKHFSYCVGTDTACGDPDELFSMSGISQVMSIDMQTPAEAFFKGFDNGFVSHAKRDIDGIANVGGIGFGPFPNAHASLTVKESREIANVHSFLWDGGEFGEHPMPGLSGAEGQSRAKQGASPGVCNEHVPPAKAEICSDLCRNVEISAEMTDTNHVVTNAILHS